MTRERRTVFGEVAEDYEQSRPDYPDALVDTVFRYGGLHAGERALEIGAGTGKATRSFVARGLEVLALEPSPGMAAILRRFHPEVVDTTFEEWTPEPHAFALVFAAQSWHWVPDHDAQLHRVADALEPRGTVALFWNGPQPHTGALGRDIEAIYRDVAPAVEPLTTQWPLDETLAELERSRRFDDVGKETFTWSREYTTAEFVQLMSTHSSHRMVDDVTRERLQRGVGAVIDAHGGSIEIEGQTELYLARSRT